MWYFNSVIEEGDLFNKWYRQKWLFIGKNKSVDSYFTYEENKMYNRNNLDIKKTRKRTEESM